MTPLEKDHYQLWEDCGHENVIEDPSSGERVCSRCGLTVLTDPITIGARVVSVREFDRRLRKKISELDAEREHYSRLHRQIGGGPCAWPNCASAPMARSKWCPEHRESHKRELTRERQARHRHGNSVTHVTQLQT